MREKILIVISSELFVRNYIRTDAFELIKEKYDCSFLVSRKISFDEEGVGRNVDYYDYRPSEIKKYFRVFNLLMWRYRYKSKSFDFRVRRTQDIKSGIIQSDSVIVKTLKIIKRIYAVFGFNTLHYVFGNKIIFPLYFAYLKKKIKTNQKVEEIIENKRPSLVIFPSSAYDAEGIDLIRICNKYNITTLFLIDNWDNLSSKSVFWVKPKYIGVWGEQSVEHACYIQGFDEKQVTLLGTPRYDEYFRVRDIRLESHFDYKYILFVGTAVSFDEAGVLVKLDKIIDDNQNIFSGIKIVYRPHPWRQGKDTILGLGLQHVIVDPQLLSEYTAKNHTVSNQPQLSYYPRLLQNAEFLIGGLTSMVIESLLFRKRFLALAYHDGNCLTSPYNIFKGYTHFDRLDLIDAISFCYDIKNLEAVFIYAWNSRDIVNPEYLDKMRRYYLYDDHRRYKNRLADLCDEILKL